MPDSPIPKPCTCHVPCTCGSQDATIASLKAALQEAEQDRDLYRTSLIEHQATLAAVERERDALRAALKVFAPKCACGPRADASPWATECEQVEDCAYVTAILGELNVAALNGEGT